MWKSFRNKSNVRGNIYWIFTYLFNNHNHQMIIVYYNSKYVVWYCHKIDFIVLNLLWLFEILYFRPEWYFSKLFKSFTLFIFYNNFLHILWLSKGPMKWFIMTWNGSQWKENSNNQAARVDEYIHSNTFYKSCTNLWFLEASFYLYIYLVISVIRNFSYKSIIMEIKPVR